MRRFCSPPLFTALKLLALSDEVVPFIYSGQIKARFNDVDLVIACGDLPYYYLEFVVSMLDVPLVYVHGNHDHRKQRMSNDRIATHAEGCVNIDGKVGTFKGLNIAGLGGSIRYRPDGVHQYTESQMWRRILRQTPQLIGQRLLSKPLDIFATHSPPFGIHNGDDRAHTGFRSFLKYLDLFQPKLMIHGHVHLYREKKQPVTQYNQTTIINIYPYRLISYSPHTGQFA